MQTSHLDLFNKRLSQAGLRRSHVRQEIFMALHESSMPLSIQELVGKVSKGHFVSVYRSVDALTKARILHRISAGHKHNYELSDDFQPHHHHATCDSCGITHEISSQQLEEALNTLMENINFTQSGHSFEVHGICHKCAVKSGISSTH